MADIRQGAEAGRGVALIAVKSSLQMLEEEHGRADDLACLVKPADNVRQVDANAEMSKSESGEKFNK